MFAEAKFFLRQVVPRVPFLIRLSIAHTLGLLETSKQWDLKTTLIVRFIRALISGDSTPTTISQQQKASMKDPGKTGPFWISSVTIPKLVEDDNVLAALLDAVDRRKEAGAKYDVPVSESIYAEWTGHRVGSNDKTPHAKEMTEAARYEKLMTDTKNDATVLYFHGGAHYLMDVATHRPVCGTLARISGGRCFSVRYRLAPKYPFPAAVFDALVAYLYLLSPPSGSLHKPVDPSNIVFAGDSAGGNLACALLQLIQQLHRAAHSGQLPRVKFFGREVEVPLPGGVACSSAWVDMTRTMPSITENAKYDYLPPPSTSSLSERFPVCELWPTNPRREDLYCDSTVLMHPITSPLATSAEDWKNSPPFFFFYGEECLADEGKYFARTLIKAGVAVEWQEYEAMPHCFPMVIKGTNVAKHAMNSWGDFIARASKGQQIETSGTFFAAKTLAERKVDVANLGSLSEKEIFDRMNEEVERRKSRLSVANEKSSSSIRAKL